MIKSSKKFLTLIFIIYQAFPQSINAQVENIKTFAKLYGYVRWFYPGDEAARVDWNRFAINGVKKVEKAKDEKELKQILLELFKPIAPALQIAETQNVKGFDKQSITPNDTFDLKPISWLHFGVGLGDINSIYKSVRVNRDTIAEPADVLYDIPDISKYKGCEFKLSAVIRSTRTYNDSAYVLLTSAKSFADITKEKINTETTIIKQLRKSRRFEKTIKPDTSNNYLLFGFGCIQDNEIAFDSISLDVKVNNTWKPVSISHDRYDWKDNNIQFHVSLDTIPNLSVKIEPSYAVPHIGEYIKKDIGNNLICIMPIALYGDKNHTYPLTDIDLLNQLIDQLNLISDTSLNSQNIDVRIANVVIAWNVFQHFYPYFDVINIDWEKVLTQTLQSVYAGGTDIDYYKMLCKMVAQLNDGHGMVTSDQIKFWGLPFAVDLIENKIVIVKSKWQDFLVGDIIKSIDGKSAMEELLDQENLISGSPQLKRNRGLTMFSSDFSSSYATVNLIRNGEEKEIRLKRWSEYYLYFNPNRKSDMNIIDCGNGIFYLKSFSNDFNSIYPEIKNTKGLIIGDDYMHREWDLIPHIIKEPVWITKLNVPVTAYPDRNKIFYSTNRWKIRPKAPFISAKLTFLNYSSNISSAETFMGIIDNYKLGYLIGDTTAGTNGDANTINLMGGYSIKWTGTKVLKHDGTQFHLIGFKPDYPIRRTLKAIKEGRDEYLEKAIEVLKGTNKNP